MMLEAAIPVHTGEKTWEMPLIARRDVAFAMGLYLLSRLVIALGSGIYLWIHHLPLASLPYIALDWTMVHDDSGWYHFIAGAGYIRQDTPFFPLFPMAMVAVHGVFGLSLTTSGLLIANASEILSFILLFRLFREYSQDDRVARMGVWLYALYPFAVFLPSLYPESLFVVLLVGCLLAVRARRYIFAAGLGFVAVLTRNEGGILAIPILAELWRERRETGTWNKRGWVTLASLPLALGSYMVYLWTRFGSPFLFTTEERLWGRHFAWPFVTLVNGFTSLPWLWAHNGLYGHIYYSLEAAFALLAVSSLVVMWKRVPRSWFWFSVIWVAVPLSDPATGMLSIVGGPRPVVDYFFSLGRLIIPMFPMFLVWGQILARRGVAARLTVYLSGTVLCGVSVLIAGHVFLA